MIPDSMTRSVRLLVTAALLTFASITVCGDVPKFGTFKVDVVSLIRDSKQEDGSQEFSTDRLGYRYLFTSAEHRDAFNKNPAAFEVQLGGACGKMAELSGRGSTSRYWVYQGHLYVFASDGCRTGFQANPEGHLERDEPRLLATPQEVKAGNALLEKAATWSGIKSIGKGGAISFEQDSTLKQGDHTYVVKGTTRVSSNGDYFDLTTYDGSGYANEIQGGKASQIDPKGVKDEHVPTWKRALERQRARNLAYILLSRSSAKLSCKFEGVADGIASVQVNIDGASSTLWIEQKTGKVISQTVKGRNSKGIIGDVNREFTKYETKGDVTLPVAWTATYNGEDSPFHERKPMTLVVRKG